MPASELDESLYFLRRFLQRPANVASVWPSSRFLAAEMLRDLQFRDGDLIVEYGPGTGAFTRHMRQLCSSSLRLRYLGIEKDPGMYRYLRKQFCELEFKLGDAARTVEFLRNRELPDASAVISGLPLMLFGPEVMQRIVAATRASLRPGGVFRTFSYLHSYPRQGAADLRRLMARNFDSFDISRPVIRNMPPAMVLTGTVAATAGFDAVTADTGGAMRSLSA